MTWIGDGGTSTGRLPRGHQLRRGPEAAARRRRREQRLGLLDAVPQADRGTLPRRQGRRVRHPGRAGRRQRRARGLRRGPARRRSGARGRRSDARRGHDLPHEGPRRARRAGLRPEGGARGVEAEGPDRALRAPSSSNRARPRRDELAGIDQAIAEEVDRDVERAEASPLPAPEFALEGVYARRAIPPRRRRRRRSSGGGREQRSALRRRLRRPGRRRARPPTSTRSARGSARRWSATSASSSSARTSASTAAPSRSPTACIGEFGEERVIDTPIAETAIVGAAVGAAMMGMRPVAEMQFIDFISCAFDMITNFAAKSRYRTGVGVPLVIRGPSGGGVHGGPFHSQNPEAYFAHTPGLKIVQPATAYDAKGLIKAAIRDDDPVLFFEHKFLYRRIKEELPAEDYVVPIGKAAVRRAGPRPLDHHLRRDGLDGARGREDARGRGHRRRGHRPAHALPARRGGDPRVGREDQQGDPPPRGHAHRRHRRRDRGRARRSAASSTSTGRSCASPRPTRRCPTRRRSRSSSCRTRRRSAARREPSPATDDRTVRSLLPSAASSRRSRRSGARRILTPP